MIYKIVLADDHRFLLEGIIAVIKEIPSVEVAATAQTGHELIDAVAKHRPAMVITDLNMPGYDGLDCLKKIKENYSSIKVLVLTNYSQPELIEQVKSMHAEGYLIKNSSAAVLREAIEIILSGGEYFPITEELKPISNNSWFADGFLKKYRLTKRETEIISLVCQEMSTKQIAAQLFLSELTINTHRRNILRKTEVKNIAGLINFAKQNGLI